MADKVVGQAVLQISIDEGSAKRVMDALEKIGDQTKKTGEHARNMSQLFSATAIKNFAASAVHAIAEVSKTIIELGEHGAHVADAAEQFGVLSQKAGGAKAVMDALRSGTAGTMSDFDLMTTANRALGAGFIQSAADAKTLSEGARVLAKATGQDTAAAYEKLMVAMAKGRVTGVKSLGLYIDTKGAVKEYAKAHNMATKELSDEDKATIVVQASIKALRERLAQTHPEAQDFEERIKAARVELTNLYDQVSVGVAKSPVIAAGLEAVSKSFSSAFGGKDKLVQTVVQAINEFVIFLGKTASVALSVAQVVVGAFFAWKTAFNTILEFFFAGITKFHGLIGSVAGAIADLTGSETFAGIADSAQRAADKTGSLAYGFGELAKQSNETGAEVLGVLGGVQTGIDGVVSAMEAQRGKIGEVTEAQHEYNAAVGDPAPKDRSLENDKQIAESKRSLLAEEMGILRFGLDQKRIAIEQEAQARAIKVLENRAMTEAEKTFELQKIDEIKNAKLLAAQLEGDELKMKKQTLQQEIAAIHQTGLDAELAANEVAKQKELQALEVLKVNYGTQYAEIVALVNQKHAEMTAAAVGHYASAEEAAAKAGFKTREEQMRSAQQARVTYEMMKQSGKFTYEELTRAKEAATEAEMKLDDTKAKAAQILNSATVDFIVQGLQMLAGKSKVAAIAAVVINTAQAISKQIATTPWPASIPGIAFAVATGATQIAKIKSQNTGFKEGTPGLDFASFGKMTQTALHGNEAVIPQGKGHMLAGEIASAMPGAGGGADLDRLADRIIAAPINPVSVEVTLDGRKLGDAVLQLSRTGALRIHASSLVTA